MEMELDHLGCDANSTEDTFLKQYIPTPIDSVDADGLFGDRQMNPRIGDEFQVEIPPMITGSEYIHLLMSPTDSDYVDHVSHSFLMGLSIPIMWLHDEQNNNDDLGCKVIGSSDEAANVDESVKYKKCKNFRINTWKKGSELNASELKDTEDSQPEKCEAKLAGRTKSTSYFPVPGLEHDAWTDAEKDIFLLGLYIFGKSFFQIKRFLETKEMGDLLSFYYGEFYRSNEYRRWSDCRKPRSRKCVYGRKIFTRWRQQELLSRLLPHVPEESQNSLQEVSKSFAEGRTSLESYVSYLKATVGTRALVESVGIGKGKEDLTSLSLEPVKTNQMFPFYPTIPSGKACSSLTSGDIIKFLTGGFRLSKARCNDIFWEAVWPRLLARGWHSEQPRNRGYVSSKDYLVFLMPGVKKFSRRKLVKGDHYFDSVSDILNKVVSEPKLLELEVEEARVSSCNEEDQWVPEELSDQDDPSNDRPHCYLKPITSNRNLERMKFMVIDSSLIHGGQSCSARELRYLPVNVKDTSKLGCLQGKKDRLQLGNANAPLNAETNMIITTQSKDVFGTRSQNRMKFTVVDTSLVHGGKLSKVTALRYFPVEYKISSDMKFLSRVDEGSSSDNSLDEQESNTADTLLNSEPDASDSLLNGNIYNYHMVAFDGTCSNKVINSYSGNNTETHLDQEANKLEDKNTKRIIKHHFSRRAKSDNTNGLAPLVKRRRLTACAKTEMSSMIENFSLGLKTKEVVPSCALNLPAGYDDVSHVCPSLEKISSLSCSNEGSPEEEISRGMISESCFGMEMSSEKNDRNQISSSIDLNASQIPFDSDNGEVLKTEMEDSQGMNSNGSSIHENKLNLEALNTSIDVTTSIQHPNMNPRRQSTRNRPPTAKALEALACGFFNIQRKTKGKEFHTRQIPFSNPSRKARSRVKTPSKRGSTGTGIVDTQQEKKANTTLINNEDIVSQSLDQFEEKSLNIQ